MSKKRPRVVGTRRQGRANVRVDIYDDGSEVVHLDDESTKLIAQQLDFFKEFFGREPEPTDPIFFDTDYPDEPTPLSIEKFRRIFLDAASRAGIDQDRALEIWEQIE